MKRFFTIVAILACASCNSPNSNSSNNDSLETRPDTANMVPPPPPTDDTTIEKSLDTANKMMDTASANVSMMLDTARKNKAKM